jgi:hypothetical protein
MYKSEIKSMANAANISVRWVIICSIARRFSSRRNQNPLSWNKTTRNISLNVDLIGMIILKFGPECFNGIY